MPSRKIENIFYTIFPANRWGLWFIHFHNFIVGTQSTPLSNTRTAQKYWAPGPRFITGPSCHGLRYMIHFKMICYAMAQAPGDGRRVGTWGKVLSQCRCKKRPTLKFGSSQRHLMGLSILLPTAHMLAKDRATFSHNHVMRNLEKLPGNEFKMLWGVSSFWFFLKEYVLIEDHWKSMQRKGIKFLRKYHLVAFSANIFSPPLIRTSYPIKSSWTGKLNHPIGTKFRVQSWAIQGEHFSQSAVKNLTPFMTH